MWIWQKGNNSIGVTCPNCGATDYKSWIKVLWNIVVPEWSLSIIKVWSLQNFVRLTTITVKEEKNGNYKSCGGVP